MQSKQAEAVEHNAKAFRRTRSRSIPRCRQRQTNDDATDASTSLSARWHPADFSPTTRDSLKVQESKRHTQAIRRHGSKSSSRCSDRNDDKWPATGKRIDWTDLIAACHPSSLPRTTVPASSRLPN